MKYIRDRAESGGFVIKKPEAIPLHFRKENTYANLFQKTSMQDRRKFNHGVVICGHRGGSNGVEPENTMRAFERGIDIGLQVIELDVSGRKLLTRVDLVF